jgi:cytochrome c oxidase subunit III
MTTAQPRLRSVIDLRALPDVVFGPRDIMWWGTLGFVLIEGFTLALCAAAYLYVTQNFATWPPENTPLPSLVAPTVQVVVMLASLIPATWTARAAHRFDLGAVRIGLTIATAFAIAIVGLRAWELLVSLNVKWESNAYGSVQWLVLGAHATLLAVELVEIGGMMLIFWLAPVEEKHMSDVADMVFYWYFMVLSWLPLYVLCFWLPRWI